MRFRTEVQALVILLALQCAHSAAIAAPTKSPDTVAASKIDARCEQILRKMTATYKGAVSLACNIKVDMKVTNADGKQQDVPATYIISLAKPNRFAVELDSTSGGKAVSNGKRAEFYHRPKNMYMITKPEATLAKNFDKDEFKASTADLVNFSLVRELMETNPYAEVMYGVKTARYIGVEKISTVSCDHVQIDRGTSSSDLWISQSDKPLLMKVQPDVPKSIRDAHRSKFLLSFVYSDQVFNKPMNDGRFEVAHPKGAHYVKEFFHEEGAELIGKKAPDVVLPMADGTKIKLSNMSDRFVILDFWATWCPPCVMSLPVFAKVGEAFKPKGVAFIAVNRGEAAATAKSYLKQNKITTALATDLDGKLAEAFHVEGIPCTIFIGKDGIVKGVHVGINPNALEKSFTEDLEKFVSGKSLKRAQ